MYSSCFEPHWYYIFLGKTTLHKYFHISAKSELSEQRVLASWINGWLNGEDALEVGESELLWRDLKTTLPQNHLLTLRWWSKCLFLSSTKRIYLCTVQGKQSLSLILPLSLASWEKQGQICQLVPYLIIWVFLSCGTNPVAHAGTFIIYHVATWGIGTWGISTTKFLCQWIKCSLIKRFNDSGSIYNKTVAG